MTSTGLWIFAVGGRSLERASTVILSSFASSRPEEDGHIRRHDSGTAGVGHNGDAIACGELPLQLAHGRLALVGKRVGVVEEFIDGIGADDARLLEKRVVDRFRSREGSRMGSGGTRAGAGSPPILSPIPGSCDSPW